MIALVETTQSNNTLYLTLRFVSRPVLDVGLCLRWVVVVQLRLLIETSTLCSKQRQHWHWLPHWVIIGVGVADVKSFVTEGKGPTVTPTITLAAPRASAANRQQTALPVRLV